MPRTRSRYPPRSTSTSRWRTRTPTCAARRSRRSPSERGHRHVPEAVPGLLVLGRERRRARQELPQGARGERARPGDRGAVRRSDVEAPLQPQAHALQPERHGPARRHGDPARRRHEAALPHRPGRPHDQLPGADPRGDQGALRAGPDRRREGQRAALHGAARPPAPDRPRRDGPQHGVAHRAARVQEDGEDRRASAGRWASTRRSPARAPSARSRRPSPPRTARSPSARTQIKRC